MVIESDPGQEMNKLHDIFEGRELFATQLSQLGSINLNISKLIIVLERLKPMGSETIINCLSQNSSHWDTLSIQLSNKEDISEQKLTEVKVEEFYQQSLQHIENSQPLEKFSLISQSISSEIDSYKHCYYQSAVAGVIASFDKPFLVITMPTGSGKTWIQGILSKYDCSQNLTVAIVEPSEELKIQTEEKLGAIDYDIQVMTIDFFYQYGCKNDIILVDEYDIIAMDYPYAIQNTQLTGLWQLRGKKVIAFTATSSPAVEKFVSKCIGTPQILKFKSEYEMVYQQSPVQDGCITSCKSDKEVLGVLENDIQKNYEIKPTIIICNDDQVESIRKIIVRNKYKCFVGVQNNIIQEIRNWDYGVLILQKQYSRGVDTKFLKDALVLIVAGVENYQQYLQMLGRSSRTRNICQGVLYVSTGEKSSVVIDKLKSQNFSMMAELAQLMILFEKKFKDANLVAAVRREHEKGAMVRSINDVQQSMSAKNFGTMMKGLAF